MIDIGVFGETLRRERERQGISLETVSDATKIRKHYLNALEQEAFDILPPRVYATGFVATYARYLKLDSNALVEQFKSLAYADKTDPTPVLAEKRSQRKKIKIPVRNIIAAAMFLIVVFWAGSLASEYIAQRGVSQPPSVKQSAAVKNPPEDNNPSVEPAASDKLVLGIAARQNCWLQVKVDGVDQFTGIIVPGENKSFEATGSIDLKAGNAGGIDLSLNNQPLAPLGNMGQVVEKQFNIDSSVKE